MATMTLESKARLAALNAERRAKTKLLKDLDCTILGILIDHFEECGNRKDIDDPLRQGHCYLKYAQPSQIECIRERLLFMASSAPYACPLWTVPLPPNRTIDRVIFPTAIIRHILKTAGVTNPERYYRTEFHALNEDSTRWIEFNHKRIVRPTT